MKKGMRAFSPTLFVIFVWFVVKGILKIQRKVPLHWSLGHFC